MGVDYDAVCFLGWEVEEPEEADNDINAEEDEEDFDSFAEKLAKEHNLEHGEYGDACYGGESYMLVGYQLYNQDLAALKQCIATLEDHPLCAKYGPPKVHCGVHMW